MLINFKQRLKKGKNKSGIKLEKAGVFQVSFTLRGSKIEGMEHILICGPDLGRVSKPQRQLESSSAPTSTICPSFPCSLSTFKIESEATKALIDQSIVCVPF